MDEYKKTKLEKLRKSVEAEVKRVEKQSRLLEAKIKELHAELRGITKAEMILKIQDADPDFATFSDLTFADRLKQIVLESGQKEMTHRKITERFEEMFPEKASKNLRQAVINTMLKFKKENPPWLGFRKKNNIMRYWAINDSSDEEGGE